MTASSRPVTVTSKVADFEFRSMLGTEEVGQPFRYDVELLSKSSKVTPETMVGSMMTISLRRRDGKIRHFNGYVTDFSLCGGVADFTMYSVTLRPWLYLLSHRTNCRIFKGDAVDIVKQVCDALEYQGISVLQEGALQRDKLPKYEFVVQFRESDFNFVMRVLERDGIYFHFEHTETMHTLVLIDEGGVTNPDYKTLRYRPPSSTSEEIQESVDSWRSHHSFTAGELTTKDFSYKAPTVDLKAKALSSPPQVIKHIEAFDYPGNYFEPGLGPELATRRLQTLQVGGCRFEGTTNVRVVSAGQLFTLADHSVAAFNREYLIHSAQFEIVSHGQASGGGAAGGGDVMRASIVGLDTSRPFHPIPRTPKPRMTGVQTAIVVGESKGQEVVLDDKNYGRVKIKFPWDLEADTTGKNSCWVRVSQAWAGTDFGVQFHPRLGQEVLVDFVEGDPDRPIIVGRVYNDANKPPYSSPTQGGIKTNSTPDGVPSQCNEIRFEDKVGSEELFVQAEKTHTVNVKGSRSVSVGGTQSTTVTGKETRTYKADRQTDVIGQDTVFVQLLRTENYSGGRYQVVSGGGDDSIVMENAKTTKVDKSWTISTGQGYKLADKENTKIELAESKVLIEAPTEVKLKCGDTTVVLTPDAVTISSKKVTITGNETSALTLDVAGANLKSATEVVVVGPSGVKLNS
jgi:type VI secretion system secreted protein VgrG